MKLRIEHGAEFWEFEVADGYTPKNVLDKFGSSCGIPGDAQATVNGNVVEENTPFDGDCTVIFSKTTGQKG